MEGFIVSVRSAYSMAFFVAKNISLEVNPDHNPPHYLTHGKELIT